MAFFEEIGKKLSQASQSAVQKTKEMSDTVKLNSSISDQEKAVRNSYIEIGKLYVEKHPEDYDSEFDILIKSIKESEEKIASLREQIRDIKGIAICENCGAEIPNTAAFCSKCGAPAPKKAEVKTEKVDEVKCECGATLAEGASFCTMCGKPVDAVKADDTDATNE